MKIIQRLYMKDFFTLLVLIASGLSLIFSLIDLTGKIDDFMPGRPSVSAIVTYALLTMPKFFLYLLPMSVLICSLFTFSQAFRRKEITAIKTAGGRLRSILSPFVVVGIILGVCAFITGESVVPDFTRKAYDQKNSFEGKSKRISLNDGSLWIRDKDGSPVKIDLYVAEKKIAQGISIFVTGKDFLKEKIEAERAYWEGTTWVLEQVTRYDVKSGEIAKLKKMTYDKLENPDLFTRDLRKSDEMGIAELYRYIQRLKTTGFRNIKLSVDFNSKISFPLINVFMMLLGISLSLRMEFGGGLFSAGLGLLISLLYWFGYTFFLSLGYTGILSPFLSAWIIPASFGTLAVYLFVTIPE